jgi:hypothetical protein
MANTITMMGEQEWNNLYGGGRVPPYASYADYVQATFNEAQASGAQIVPSTNNFGPGYTPVPVSRPAPAAQTPAQPAVTSAPVPDPATWIQNREQELIQANSGYWTGDPQSEEAYKAEIRNQALREYESQYGNGTPTSVNPQQADKLAPPTAAEIAPISSQAPTESAPAPDAVTGPAPSLTHNPSGPTTVTTPTEDGGKVVTTTTPGEQNVVTKTEEYNAAGTLVKTTETDSGMRGTHTKETDMLKGTVTETSTTTSGDTRSTTTQYDPEFNSVQSVTTKETHPDGSSTQTTENYNTGITNTANVDRGNSTTSKSVEGKGSSITVDRQYDSDMNDVESRTVTQTDPNGSTKVTTHNNNTGTTTVNETDRVKGTVTETKTNADGSSTSTTTQYDPDFNETQSVSKTTTTVNENGQKATVHTENFAADGKTTTSTSDETYTYHENGNLATKVTEVTEGDPNSNGKKTTTSVNYDEKGLYNGKDTTIEGKDGTTYVHEVDKTGQNYTTTNTAADGTKTTTTTSNNILYSQTVDANGNVTVTDLNGNVLYTTDKDGNITSEGSNAQQYLDGDENLKDLNLVDENGKFDIDKFDINEDQLMSAINTLNNFMGYCNESASQLGAVSTDSYIETGTTGHNQIHNPSLASASDNLRAKAMCLNDVCGTEGAQSGFAPLLGRLCNTVNLIRGSNDEVNAILGEAAKQSAAAGTGSGDPGSFAGDASQTTGSTKPGVDGGTNPDPSSGSGATKEGDKVKEDDMAKGEDTEVEESKVEEQETKPTTKADDQDSSDAKQTYKKGGGGGHGGGGTKDSTAATNEDATSAIDDMALGEDVPVVEIVETGNQIHEIGELSTLGADIGSLNIEALTNHISAKNIGAAAGVGLAAAGAAAAIAAYKDKKDEEENEAMDDEYSSTDYQADPNLNYDDLMI